MAKSKLYTLTKKIREYEGKISTLMNEKESAREDIKKLLEANFYKLKNFIEERLFDTLPENEKKAVEERLYKEKKEAEQRKLMKELFPGREDEMLNNSATSYSYNQNFDPYIDGYEIYDCLLSEDKKSVKIRVECLKNRGYLGITGCWIPSIYETDWIPVKEIVEYEN